LTCGIPFSLPKLGFSLASILVVAVGAMTTWAVAVLSVQVVFEEKKIR